MQLFASCQQTDVRAAATSRQQMVTGKDGDMWPAIGGATIKIEEKIHRLPVGGEGWDRKMKRKRSVASVGSRVMNGEQDIKQAIQQKMSAGSKLQSCDAQALRWFTYPSDWISNVLWFLALKILAV